MNTQDELEVYQVIWSKESLAVLFYGDMKLVRVKHLHSNTLELPKEPTFLRSELNKNSLALLYDPLEVGQALVNVRLSKDSKLYGLYDDNYFLGKYIGITKCKPEPLDLTTAMQESMTLIRTIPIFSYL